MKAMISQPMGGLSDTEIKAARKRAETVLAGMGYEVAASYFAFSHKYLEIIGVKNIPLMYLAKSLEVMSKCDAVYFVDGWESARGCCIEHTAAALYGIAMLYEKPEAEE